jgi:uncharacterized membrane protein
MYFVDLFLMFITFSFFGWVIETIYCSIWEKRFVHRGFLNGPVCPIYGIGALAVGIPLSFINVHPIANYFLVFLAGVIICTILEYLVGVILEKIFNLKLWDYSNFPRNINGRVWIGYSLGWGFLSILLVFFINPGMTKVLALIPANIKYIITIFLATVFITDFVFTILNLSAISKKLDELKKLFTKLQLKLKALGEQGADFSFLSSKKDDELENYKKLANKLSKHRIIRTFPHFTIKRFAEQLKLIKNKIKAEKNKKQ